MPTLIEVKNDWRKDVEAAKGFAEAGDMPQYEAAFASAEQKRKQYEAMKAAEDALDALGGDGRPTIGDLRDPDDADDVPNAPKDVANARPKDYIQLAPGRFVPFATKTTEGFNRKAPAAVQLPSIMARYEPGGQLWNEAELQRRAINVYLRKGANAAEFNDPKLRAALRAMAALQEDTDTEGGYLVPSDQRVEVVRDPGYPGGALRAHSRIEQTVRDGGTFPTATSFTWGRISEEQSPTPSDPAFSQVSFTIRKSGVNTILSEELLADSAVDLPALLGRMADEKSGAYEDQQGIEGDGSTEPLGLRTTGAPQGNITDQNVTAAGLTLANMTDLFMSVPSQFRGDMMGLFTTSAFWAKVMAISASGGQIWQIPNGAERPGFLFFGKPVFFYDGTGWDDAAALSATEEFGAIGDFSHYVFVDRQGLIVKRDDSRYSDSDQVLFRMRKRFDAFFDVANAFRIVKGA